MHLLGGADDRVYRTRLYALGAAYADVFINKGDRTWTLCAIDWIEWYHRLAKQGGNTGNAFCAARGALVIVGQPVGDGLGIRPASGISALGALGLRQQIFDTICQ